MLNFTEQDLNQRCYEEYMQALEFHKYNMYAQFVTCIARAKLYESLKIEAGYNFDDMPRLIKDIETECMKKLNNIEVKMKGN